MGGGVGSDSDIVQRLTSASVSELPCISTLFQHFDLQLYLQHLASASVCLSYWTFICIQYLPLHLGYAFCILYLCSYFSSYCSGGVFLVLFILNSTVSEIVFSTRAMYFKSHLLRLIGLPLLTELSNKTASFLFCISVHIFCIFTPQYLYLCLPIFVFASHYTCKCTPLFLDPQKQAFLDKVFRSYNQCLRQSPSYFHIQPSTKRPN